MHNDKDYDVPHVVYQPVVHDNVVQALVHDVAQWVVRGNVVQVMHVVPVVSGGKSASLYVVHGVPLAVWVWHNSYANIVPNWLVHKRSAKSKDCRPRTKADYIIFFSQSGKRF